MIARSVLVLLLCAGVARAQSAPDPEWSDEPPPEAARAAVPETPPIAAEPAVQTVARKRRAGSPTLRFGILPGYRHAFGSDWIGTSAELAWGGEAKNGFAVLARVGLFAGASTFRVPFQHWTVAVVFVIPTQTRLWIELGQTFGMFVIEEQHTYDGFATSPTIGAFLAPTVDLWRSKRERLYLETRLSYDWIPSTGSGTALTGQLGLGLAF